LFFLGADLIVSEKTILSTHEDHCSVFSGPLPADSAEGAQKEGI